MRLIELYVFPDALHSADCTSQRDIASSYRRREIDDSPRTRADSLSLAETTGTPKFWNTREIDSRVRFPPFQTIRWPPDARPPGRIR